MAQAAAINATRHPILQYVGGVISPEMELPKLLWLKTHMPDTFKRAVKCFDLADYLSYRATGSDGTHRSSATKLIPFKHIA